MSVSLIAKKVISPNVLLKNRLQKSFCRRQKSFPCQFEPKAEKLKNNHNSIRQNNTTKITNSRYNTGFHSLRPILPEER